MLSSFLLSQLDLLQLAGRRPDQVVDELDGARHLEPGNVLLEGGDQLCLADLRAGLSMTSLRRRNVNGDAVRWR